MDAVAMISDYVVDIGIRATKEKIKNAQEKVALRHRHITSELKDRK